MSYIDPFQIRLEIQIMMNLAVMVVMNESKGFLLTLVQYLEYKCLKHLRDLKIVLRVYNNFLLRYLSQEFLRAIQKTIRMIG